MTSNTKQHGLLGTFILSRTMRRIAWAVGLAAALAVAGQAQAEMIGVHWSNYAGNSDSSIVGTDGVVPQSNWNNLGTNWYSGSASNLVDSNGAATTAAVDINATGAGTCWWVTGPTAGLSNLLVGPWGGNGPRANVITGIPSSYSTYDIIAYVNQPYGGNWNVWLDGNPAASNAANAHAAGSDRYFSPTEGAPGFAEITNTTPGTYPAGNYVVFSGLSGSAQTLWVDGNGDNRMIAGFQIINVPEPSTVVLLIGGVIGLLACVWRRR